MHYRLGTALKRGVDLGSDRSIVDGMHDPVRHLPLQTCSYSAMRSLSTNDFIWQVGAMLPADFVIWATEGTRVGSVQVVVVCGAEGVAANRSLPGRGPLPGGIFSEVLEHDDTSLRKDQASRRGENGKQGDGTLKWGKIHGARILGLPTI